MCAVAARVVRGLDIASGYRPDTDNVQTLEVSSAIRVNVRQ